jgi:cytidine deaminase
MCNKCRDGTPVLHRKKPDRPALHVIEAGKHFTAKNCMFFALADSTVIAKRNTTGVFADGSHGEAHAGSNFTAESGSHVSALFGSSGVAKSGSFVIKHYGANIKVEDGADVVEVADDERHLPPGHIVTHYDEVSQIERDLIDLAKDRVEAAYCPYSGYFVGAAVWAENDKGERSLFWGVNRETAAFNGVCAERMAIDDAVKNGFRKVLLIAAYCAKNPGGSPDPFVRQDMLEHGIDATVLNVFNGDDTVVKFTVRQLFPQGFGGFLPRSLKEAA